MGFENVASINDVSIELVQYPPIGKEWVDRFIGWHKLSLLEGLIQPE